MKKFFLFLLFIPIISCSNTNNGTKETADIDCPSVYFSSENNVYVYPENEVLDLEEVSFKASLNNYGFDGKCFSNSDYNNYNLQLLLIVEPLNPKNENITLPIFILFYNSDNKLVDKQYFRLEEKLNFDKETLKYNSTEIISNINIYQNNDNSIKYLTIGFVKILL